MDSFADMYTAPERVLGGLHVPSAAAYLVLSAVAYLAYLIFAHRDGSALGCSPRPDLEAVPGGVPLLGNLIDSIRNGERQLEWWQRLRREQHDKSKPLSVTLPVGIRLIDIRNDPACLQHILKDRFQNYIKPKLLQKVVFDFLGSGIFAVNGTEWKVQRQATAKIFTKTQFRTVISSAINSDIVKVVKCFGHYSDSAKSLDLTELLLSFTLSSFGKMAFGLNMDCLVEEGAKRSEFGEAFDICQRISALRIPNPFWRVSEAFSADGRAMKASVKVINHHTYKIIDERQADLKHASSLEDGQARDLLDLYMSARSDSGHALDRKQLRDAVLNLIIAGRDTTAQALSWIYFHLLSQPRYLQLLREDADALFEKDGKIDFDNFRELKFTEAVFNEGLRLHPPVPKSSRQAVAADILPNGTRVDAGDMIRWSNWEIGRDEGVWGPDAKSFRPERWIEEIDGEKHVMNVGQFKGNWFHGGPRLCLGQNLATYEAMLFLATVSRSFDFKFAEGYFKSTEMIDVGEPIPTPRYANAFTLPFKESFMVDVARRASK